METKIEELEDEAEIYADVVWMKIALVFARILNKFVQHWIKIN